MASTDRHADPERLGIGDFARASGLTPKALRLYDELGLLRPVEVDPVTGYRSYDPAQLDRARLVARLRRVGMPLTRIAQVAEAAGRGDPRAAAAEVTSYWRQVEADTGTARALVAELLLTLHPKEHDMGSTPTTSTTSTAGPVAAHRTGIGARPTQQDAVAVGPGAYAVADGFGDAVGLAARVSGLVVAEVAGAEAGADLVETLDAGFARAVGVVARGWAEHRGAGTTLTTLALRGDRGVVGHLGDSRLHRVRAGRVERLTRDHTVVQTLVDEGRLTPEEAQHDDRRVLINRAVSADVGCTPDLAVLAVEAGDRYVLTTDGVHGRLGAAVLADLVTVAGSADDVAAAVAAAVEEAGAEDNYSVLVVDVPVAMRTA